MRLSGLFLLLALFLPTPSLLADTPIRVQVVSHVPEVTINGRRIEAPTQAITISDRTQRYQIGKRHFQGTLKVIPTGDRLSVVNILPLEAYLVGLVGSELPSSWPIEAMKAQAVAARSYALASMERASRSNAAYDLTSTVLDQVYHGTQANHHRAARAVELTHGEILTSAEKEFNAYYHSCCGGQTESAHHVWENASPSPLVIDTFCRRSPKLTWKVEVPFAEFQSLLAAQGIEVKNILAISTTQREDAPRNEMILFTDDDGMHLIKATELRRALGYDRVKSTWFNVGMTDKGIILAGRGHGHGVGMCQWGAKGMADAGHTYREILKFYYPQATIVKNDS